MQSITKSSRKDVGIRKKTAAIIVVKMVSYTQSFFISPIADKNSDDLLGLRITRLSSTIRLVYASMASPEILQKHSASSRLVDGSNCKHSI